MEHSRIRVGRLFPILAVIGVTAAIVFGAPPTRRARAETPTAQTAAPKPASFETVAAQKEKELASRFTTAQRAKLPQAAKDLLTRMDEKPAKGAAPKTLDTHAREVATTTWAVLGSMNNADIEALAFLVLVQASKSAQEDFKAIMAKVKAINAAKQCQRSAPCIKALQPTAEYDGATLNAVRDQAGTNLDSLSEMGEMESLRLQMAMDRRSKLMSTLSNLLKKISDTSSGITQNLK
jgi:hypothetical protein